MIRAGVIAGDGPRDPTRALACALIMRALYDAVVPPTGSGSHAHRPHPAEQEAARRFLLDEETGWADSRAFWAGLAGLDSDAVRDRARRVVALGPSALNVSPSGGVAPMPSVNARRRRTA